MSTSDYNRLYNNVYTKNEVDNIIQSNSGGIIVDNSVFIELRLGPRFTAEQSANIANGSFTNLPIGSYWTKGSENFRIMARDQFYGYNGIDKHHLVVMPDTIYTMQKYNNSDTNGGGYNSSILKNYIINTYNPMITNAFGSNHVLSHTHDLTSGSYNSGTLTPTSDTKAWLINSYNVDGSKYQYETTYNWQEADMTQFPAFKYNTSLKIANYNDSANYWWLGSSSSSNSSYFCLVTSSGTVDRGIASVSPGVRPAFLLY